MYALAGFLGSLPWIGLGLLFSGLCPAALLLLSIAVVLGAIEATGLAFDGLVGAFPAEAEFLAPLALLGGAYAFEGFAQ